MCLPGPRAWLSTFPAACHLLSFPSSPEPEGIWGTDKRLACTREPFVCLPSGKAASSSCLWFLLCQMPLPLGCFLTLQPLAVASLCQGSASARTPFSQMSPWFPLSYSMSALSKVPALPLTPQTLFPTLLTPSVLTSLKAGQVITFTFSLLRSVSPYQTENSKRTKGRTESHLGCPGSAQALPSLWPVSSLAGLGLNPRLVPSWDSSVGGAGLSL